MENSLQEVKQLVLNISYPIGAIYISVNSINPKEFFGGEWQQIKDRFLLCCGEKFAAGQTGGEEQHTLQSFEMPTHNHQISLLDASNLTGAVRGVCTWESASLDGKVTASKEMNSSGTGVGDRHWSTLSFNFNHSHNISCESCGAGEAHNNMPPYLAVYAWQRIK